MAANEERPPTVGEQLGLGPMWQPTGVKWRWAEIATNRGRTHVLVVETPTGTTGVPFTDSDLEQFIDRTRAALSGVVAATEADLPRASQVIDLGALR